MIKKIVLIITAFCISITPVYADDLEQRVADLEKRVAALEAMLTSSNQESNSVITDMSSTIDIEYTKTSNPFKVTITGAKTCNSILSMFDDEETPGNGNVFLVIDYDVMNIGEEDEFCSMYNFKGYADNYEVEQADFFPENINILNGDIMAGKQMAGSIIFVVPSDWTVFDAYYSDYGDNSISFVITPDSPIFIG